MLNGFRKLLPRGFIFSGITNIDHINFDKKKFAKLKNPEIINLYGDFFEIGRDWADKLGINLIKQLYLYDQELRPDDPKMYETYKNYACEVINTILQNEPKEVQDFLRGAAESKIAKQHNLSKFHFVCLNSCFVLSLICLKFNGENPTHCSVLMKPGNANDPNFIAGRNNDWNGPLHSMNYFPSIVTISHSDKEKYPNRIVMPTRPMMISALTMIADVQNSDEIFYQGINAANYVDNPLKKQFYPDRPDYFAMMLLSLMQSRDFDALLERIKNTEPFYAFNVSLAGKGEGKAVVIENLPLSEKGKFVARVRTNSTPARLPDNGEKKEHIPVTNTFILQGWDQFLGEVSPPIESPTFSFERYQNLDDLYKRVCLAIGQVEPSKEHFVEIFNKFLNTPNSNDGATVAYHSNYQVKNHDGELCCHGGATFVQTIVDSKSNSALFRFQQVADNHSKSSCEAEQLCNTSKFTGYIEIQIKPK